MGGSVWRQGRARRRPAYRVFPCNKNTKYLRNRAAYRRLFVTLPPELVMTMAVPYKDSKQSKKVQIAAMFNSIAKWYDFLNHFLTLGIDIIWRKKAVAKLKDTGAQRILDIATGTGDLAIAAAKLRPATIIGIDISIEMVNIGKAKVEKKNLQRMITLQEGDSEKIIFPENYFDTSSSRDMNRE